MTKAKSESANKNLRSMIKARINPTRSPLYISLTIITIITVWIGSGFFSETKQENEQKQKAAVHLQKVHMTNSIAQDRLQMIQLTGITAPNRRVELKAEVTGQVESVSAVEGREVKAGDTILTIETRDRQMRLNEAIATTKRFEIDYNIAVKLNKKGFQAENALAAAAQGLAEANSQQRLAEINVKNSTITAPFSGILNNINAEIGDLVGPGISLGIGSLNQGSSIATIIDTNPLVIQASVSEQAISKVKLNVPTQIRLISGQTHEGKISYISKIADPVTRSFTIEVSFPNPDYTTPSGITAGVSVPTSHKKAHFVANSHLSLNNQGQIGVKTLNNINNNVGTVTFYPVEIFDHDHDQGGVWVTNLPDTSQIITLGQAFVSSGQLAIGVADE